VRLDELLATIKPYVVGWMDRHTKKAARRVALDLTPQHGYTNAAGNCCWAITAGGGASAVKWVATGSGVQYRWLQAQGSLPSDYVADTSVEVWVRLKAASGTPSIENWQFYATVAGAGDNDSWRTANADNMGATINGVSAVVSSSGWVDYRLKAFTVPSGTTAGDHIVINFGPGANSVSWSGDILCGGVWCSYSAAW